MSIRTNQPEVYPNWLESHIITNKDLKTKLDMHNIIEDVALANSSQETNYFPDIVHVQYPK